MSPSGPKADMTYLNFDVRCTSESGHPSTLFNYLIGEREHLPARMLTGDMTRRSDEKRHDEWHFLHRVGQRRHNRTGNRVRDVVMSPQCMINRVAATASRASLKTNKLCGETWMIEQLGAATVQNRKQARVQVRLRLRCRNVFDVVDTETLPRPLTAIAVAANGGDVVALQNIRELLRHIVRAEGWLALT